LIAALALSILAARLADAKRDATDAGC